MSVLRDRALLLRRHPFGESSLVVHVATRDHGRIHLLARGAYRTTSRYFAILDQFDELELEWDQHPLRELANLRAGEIVRRRRAIPGDLERYRAGTAMLELAELASRAGHPDRGLYAVLDQGLEELQRETLAADRALVVFELRFLQNLGLEPALSRCAACAGPAPAIEGDRRRVAFSAGAGGRLCRTCAEEARASGRRVGTMPMQVLEDALRLLADGPQGPGDFLSGLPQERVDRVRDFSGRFLDYHLETQPRTHKAFLSVENRNAPRRGKEQR
jgi:DNA repair protein RecO (recombination protein O)